MNELSIRLRSMARRSGIASVYHKLLPQREYEQAFHQALLRALRAGDTVWDIAANRGFYSKIFCELTGREGRVVAFEPSTGPFQELCQATSAFPWIRHEQVALADFDGVASFSLGDSDVTSHLVLNEEFLKRGEDKGEEKRDHQPVRVVRGDSYSAASGMVPNIVKIDVKGYEEEVLRGMMGLLDEPKLRAVLLEVHFGVLERRSLANAPLRIERLLRGKGFQADWVDRSHIAALR